MDGMFRKLLEPVMNRIHPVTIEGIKNFTNKESRIIDTLEPVMNQHKLIVNFNSALDDGKLYNKEGRKELFDNKHYRFFYQLTRITKERGSILHDDTLDAVAMGVTYFVNLMNNDIDRRIDDHNDEMLQRDLENWYVNAVSPIDHEEPIERSYSFF